MLWADMPNEARMTLPALARCYGANGAQRWARWSGLLLSPRCPRAVYWRQEGRYMPCGGRTLEVGVLCVTHGGPRRLWPMKTPALASLLRQLRWAQPYGGDIVFRLVSTKRREPYVRDERGMFRLLSAIFGETISG